jgi:hypothetical protein
MSKIFYVTIGLVAIGFSLIQATTGQGNQLVNTSQAANIVVRVPSLREPVQITRLQVWGSDISLGKGFGGDENWINGLSIEVNNISRRSITELQMTLSFETTAIMPRRISIPFTYDRPLLPNQVARLSPSAASVASLRDVLGKQGVTANFRKGELHLQAVKFQDGSVWVKGATLGPRDPRTGKRKRM